MIDGAAPVTRALGVVTLLLLSACSSGADSGADDMPGGASVLVDMDAGPGDAEALRILLGDETVRVAAVSLSPINGLNCEDGTAEVRAAMAAGAREDVPVVCGPAQAGAEATGDLDDLDDDLLAAVTDIVALGPLTNVAMLLSRTAEAGITIAAGEADLAADPGAAQRVIADRTATIVPPGTEPAPEQIAAWLTIDETLGDFALGEVEIGDDGRLSEAGGGVTVRRVEGVDTERITALAAEADPPDQSGVPSPELRWRTDIGNSTTLGYHTRPALVDDTVIVGGVNGEVHGLSVAGGETVWTIETGDTSLMASIVAYADGIVVLSGGFENRPELMRAPVMGSKLFALDVEEQSVLWTFEPESLVPDSSMVSSAAIVDEVVYAGTGTGPGALASERGMIFALDLRTGDLAWRTDGFGGASEPLVTGDDLVVGGTDGTLRLLDRHSGELRWERELVVAVNGIASRPLVADGTVYVTGDDGSVHALDQHSGETLWQAQPTTEPIPASPVLAGDRLIVAANVFGGTTRALDPGTGEELWAVRTGGVLGDPVVYNGTVVITTFSPPGSVVGLDLSTGEKLWEFDSPETISGSPVVAGDVLIYDGSDVYALELP